jgi:hypothetical protein
VSSSRWSIDVAGGKLTSASTFKPLEVLRVRAGSHSISDYGESAFTALTVWRDADSFAAGQKLNGSLSKLAASKGP